jgi:hypothetical protein
VPELMFAYVRCTSQQDTLENEDDVPMETATEPLVLHICKTTKRNLGVAVQKQL